MSTRYRRSAIAARKPAHERRTGGGLSVAVPVHGTAKGGIRGQRTVPHVAESIDDICVIRSMYADVPNHEPSLLLLNCGDRRQIRPASARGYLWLGSENQNLPVSSHVSRRLSDPGIAELQSAFLPAPSRNLHRHAASDTRTLDREHSHTSVSRDQAAAKQLDHLAGSSINAHGKTGRPTPISKRVSSSFELAYGMQRDAEDAFDVSREPRHIREMFGPGFTLGRS